MKKKVLLIIFIVTITISSQAQILFEKGYFIDESDKKTECLIKNIDWKNNPTEFEFKLGENAEIQKAGIKSVKEFGVNGYSRFIRVIVQIDRSKDGFDAVSATRNPVFTTEELFLKVLVEGAAVLYSYENGKSIHLFYKAPSKEINELIYKEYYLNDGIAKNVYFRQQLLNEFKEKGVTLNDVTNLNYNQKDIAAFFEKVGGGENKFADYKSKHSLYNLSVRFGLINSNLALRNYDVPSWDYQFNNNLNFKFGVENELIMPFKKGKWSVIIEPTFQYLKLKESVNQNSSDNVKTVEVNYKSIEIPISVRHYFFLNDKSKLFINAGALGDFNINSYLKLLNNSGGEI